MTKALRMEFASSLTELCELNSSFDQGVLKVCYTGDNRNRSSISKETLSRCSKTIKNVPVVCNYNREDDSFGGHDMDVVKDSEGHVHIINLTYPVGVVPESADVWFADDEDEFGVTHEYMFTNVLLWKRQEAYNKIKKDGVVSHSMEIAVKDSELVGDILHIKDFEFTALALIGVKPCYESSSLEVFSSGGFKARMEEMMRDLKEHYSSMRNDSASSEDECALCGGTILNEKELKEVVDPENNVDEKDGAVEDAEADVEENVEESAEVKEEAHDVDDVAESEDSEDANCDAGTPEDASDVSEFSLSRNVEHELVTALSSVKYVTRWGDEMSRYEFEDFDNDKHEVYFVDRTDMNVYGCEYYVSGDFVGVKFETAQRKKRCYADFEVSDNADVADNCVNAFAAIVTDMEEKLVSAYERAGNAEAKIADISAENESLKAFKASKEEEEFKSNVDSVFKKFADIHETEEFAELASNLAGLTIEQIEDKCFSIRGRHMEEKFSLGEDTAVKIMVPKFDGADSAEPYGGVFLKYANKH